MEKIWDGFDQAPKDALCVMCLNPIPEGEQCYGKTLLIGEGILGAHKHINSFVCVGCYQKSAGKQ